ncbi:MAG: GTPase Era [Lachnospiraceae bacterium]|jgi:GTP-binding protein Era|nr:GTPase Era [Lachnospiraceae bacterium]MCI1397963.1 GTPase Era [Lachnospiraceae bacterium]MCI1423882.1 GTPase Era [Lachnospiraceae bacterium]MCI1452749.1 GTPase Era [Lachnospiraceae bacterium]
MAKAGFAAIIGKPNVGKSTLMNTLIGQKIAITSYKPQTTRNQIRTIYTDENGQVVFLDTPGIFTAKDRLGRYMEKSAENAIQDVDVVLWLVEPKDKLKEEDLAVLSLVAKSGSPVIIVITKTDTVKKEVVLAVIAAYANAWQKETGKDLPDIIPVSARTRNGMEELKSLIFDKLPEGEPFYDPEEVTTQTQREIAAEIIREKALRLLQEEVPHGIAVEIRTMHQRKAKGGAGEIWDIDADVFCERESHKGIIIGKGGAMLKKIGTAARIDMENMLQSKVNLHLFVKVRPGWKDDAGTLRGLGYDEKKLRKE